MDIRTSASGDVLVIHIGEDRVDAAVAIRFKDAVRELARGGPPRVVLDMSRVGFLDSSGLGAIVSVMKGLDPGSRLELAAVTPNVEKVLRLTRMDTVLAVHRAVPGQGLADAC